MKVIIIYYLDETLRKDFYEIYSRKLYWRE